MVPYFIHRMKITIRPQNHVVLSHFSKKEGKMLAQGPTEGSRKGSSLLWEHLEIKKWEEYTGHL